MITRNTTCTCVGLVIMFFAYTSVGHCLDQQEVRRNFPVQAGATISLENVSGDITISSWGGSQVEMVAVKNGPADQLDEVDIEVDAQPSRLTIKTIRPKGKQNNVSVDYTLKVPHQVNLDSIKSVSGDVDIVDIQGRVVARSVSGGIQIRQVGDDTDVEAVSGDITVSDITGRTSARSVNGDVTVNAVQGDLEAKSVSGDVSLTRISGYIQCESVSGDVTIRESDPTSLKVSTVSGEISFGGNLNAGGRYELKSHSGTIELALPAGSSFSLQTSTFSGSVDSDFEIKIQGVPDKKKLSGVVGSGGPTLDLRSFSGNILIRRSR